MKCALRWYKLCDFGNKLQQKRRIIWCFLVGYLLYLKVNLHRRSIVAKIEGNPYYRFQSASEIKIGAELGIKIDVNRASVDDWLRLPGISIVQARNLVEITTSGIQFLCLEDLANALGISVLQIQPWQPILYFAYYANDSFIAPT